MARLGRLRRRRRKPSQEILPGDAAAVLDARVMKLFVNRLQETALFRAMLAAEQASPRILLLIGVSGSGKSWTLRHLKHVGHRDGHPVAFVDLAEDTSPLQVLERIASALEDANVQVRRARLTLERVREAHARVHQELGGMEVVIGAEGGTTRVAMPDVQKQISLLVAPLLAGDASLYFYPERSVADALLEDLDASSKGVGLLFDSYTSGTYLDTWLADFARRFIRSGICVLGANEQLSDAWTQTSGAVVAVAHTNLSSRDARECLTRYANSVMLADLSEETEKAIAQFAQGSPLAISCCLELLSRNPAVGFSAVQDALYRELLERVVTQGSPSTQFVVRLCAVARWVSADVLSALRPRSDPAVLAALAALPLFRASGETVSLHPKVKAIARLVFSEAEESEEAALHAQLMGYHESQVSRYGIASVRGQRSALELIYHAAHSTADHGLSIAASLVSGAFESSVLEFCGSLIDEADASLTGALARPWIQSWRAELSFRHGDWPTATSTLEALVRDASDHPAVTPARITLGRIYYQSGRLNEAATQYDEALAGLAARPSPQLASYVLEQSAKLHRMWGRLDRAVALHEKGLDAARTAGATYAYTSGLGSYGTTLIMAGRLEQGVAQLLASIDGSRHHGYRQFVATGLRSRVMGLILLGRFQEAVENATESIAVSADLNDDYNSSTARAWLALAMVRARRDAVDGQVPNALLRRAVEVFVRLDTVYDLGNTYLVLAEEQLCSGRPEEALRMLDLANEQFNAVQFTYGHAQARLLAGRIYASLHQLGDASRLAGDGVDLAVRVAARYVELSGRVARMEYEVAAGSKTSRAEQTMSELGRTCVSERYFDLASACALARFRTAQAYSNSEELAGWAIRALQHACRYAAPLYETTAEAIATATDLRAEPRLRDLILDEWLRPEVTSDAGWPMAVGEQLELSAYARTPWLPHRSLREYMTTSESH